MKKKKVKFKQFEPCQAIVFDPSMWEPDEKHPLKRGQLVYFLGEIPNVPGHCIVTTWEGKVISMVHPGDFREPTDEEV